MAILTDDIIKILVAILCGGILGLEREYQNKAAGFRTIILITLGATIFTIVSQRISGSDDRIAANIITGIGFIGAGVIFKGSFDVKGLTTAAVIWIAAAIGMTIGIANYQLAIGLSILVLLILSLFGKIESVIDYSNYRKKYHLTLNSMDMDSIQKIEDMVRHHNLKILHKDVLKKENQLVIVMEISGNKENVKQLSETLLGMPEVVEI